MQQLGRYEVLEELGHGAMGTVYRARDPKIERVVAIKTVRVIGTTPEQETEYRRRFFREAQAAGKLSHPGIVTIYDVGEDEATQTPYIVMEYVEGSTLESLLTDPGLEPRSLTASLELIKQVAEALDYAHTYSIVHRDIKPANIMVTAEGRAKITDFGIAKLTQSEFTVPGQILGTPAYLSPEQLKGIPIDGRSDLFALGVILYWTLAGRKPFAGDTSTVLYQVACEEPPPVTQLNPALPPELDRVVSGALAKDPASRYQRGKELADDLDDLLHGRAPRRASGVLPPTVLERTLVEPRPGVPVERRVEKTVVERPPLVSGTAPAPLSEKAIARPGGLQSGNKRRWAVAAGILVLLLLLAGVGWWWSESSESPSLSSQSPTARQGAPAKARGASRTAGGRGNRKQQRKEEEKEKRKEGIEKWTGEIEKGGKEIGKWKKEIEKLGKRRK